jgi:hypothetical protein
MKGKQRKISGLRLRWEMDRDGDLIYSRLVMGGYIEDIYTETF